MTPCEKCKSAPRVPDERYCTKCRKSILAQIKNSQPQRLRNGNTEARNNGKTPEKPSTAPIVNQLERR